MTRKDGERKDRASRMYEILSQMFFEKYLSPIKNLITWIWRKAQRIIGEGFKKIRSAIPWFILFCFIPFWILAVVWTPAYVWNLTPDFNSKVALSDAYQLEDDATNSEIEIIGQVSQAVTLERKGELELALEKYQASEKSVLPSTQTYVNDAIERVQGRISNPLRWRLLYDINNFLAPTPRWVMLIVAVALAFLGLNFIYNRTHAKQDFAIGEFVTPKSIDQESEYGNEVRQTLSDTIALIQLIHAAPKENLFLLTERLVFPSFGLSGSDKDELLRGVIELSDAPILQTTGISLARLLNLFQISSQRKQNILVGSLNKLDGEWYLTAKMLHGRGKKLLNQWETRQSELAGLGLTTKELSKSDKDNRSLDLEIVQGLGRALSYKILFTLLKQSTPSLEFKSWKGFYHLTEGLWNFQEYGIDSTTSVSHDRAVSHLSMLVDQLDYGNRTARFDLGLLYLMQGEVETARLVFDYLKSSIDSAPEVVLDNIIQDLTKEGSFKEANSMVTKHLWKKYSEELEEIIQEYRGGILPMVARSWEELHQHLIDYRVSNGQLREKIAVSVRLRSLLDNWDVGKPFRQVIGFEEGLPTDKAIEKFIGILNADDGVELIKISSSIMGHDESTRIAWDSISNILDTKYIEEANRAFEELGRQLISLKWLTDSIYYEKKMIDTTRAFLAFSEKARSEVVEIKSAQIAEALSDDDLEKANQIFKTLRQYLAESSPMMAKINMQIFLLKVDEPPLLHFYALLQPEKTEDYLSLFEWQTSKRQPIYHETLYNLALCHYLTFSKDGYAQTISLTNELINYLKFNKHLVGKPERGDELIKIASCLQVNAYVRSDLLQGGARNFGRTLDGTDGIDVRELRMMLDRIEFGLIPGDVTIKSIYSLIHHTSTDVRAAAFETVGLWTANKKSYYGQEHESYFQSALSLRSWASSYIYLAESNAEKSNYKEAFRLLDIAKRQMPKLDYIDCLEKMWLAKMKEEKAESGQPISSIDRISE